MGGEAEVKVAPPAFSLAEAAGKLANLEDEVVKSASAARSTSDLGREVRVLDRLEKMARQLLHAAIDSKWETLRGMLDLPPVRASDGMRRKLVVFTESRDTLNHLVGKLRNHIGKTEKPSGFRLRRKNPLEHRNVFGVVQGQACLI